MSRSAPFLCLTLLLAAAGRGECGGRQTELADTLTKPVKFGGFEADSRYSLGEALDFLADRFDLTFDVNEKAFEAEKVKNVFEEPVAKKAVPKMLNVGLATVLQEILDRVPCKSGATYVIRKDRIEITTRAQLRAEIWGKDYKGPFLPLVTDDVKETPLDDVLKGLSEQAGFNIIIDARVARKARLRVTFQVTNAPLDTVVRDLADMAGLDVKLSANVLYVTGREGATPEEAARRKQP
jgi:hypothetical protein